MRVVEKHSLLVVDDEPQVLDSIYDLFRRDYKVHRAVNAATAKEILGQTPIHIVMSDQRMPDVTGVELLREIREQYPDTIRLIFTAYADLSVVVQAINEGQVFRYIEKGSGPDELKSVVRQAADYYDLRMERQRLVSELQQANEDLRKADALKAAFLNVASHELNTPVTIIKGIAELAREDAEQPGGEPFRSFVKIVQAGAQRLEHLVANMLKLLQAGSFRAEVEREEIACRALFDAVELQVAPFLARRHQTLECAIEPESATLLIDRAKMHDVITNLVMNAIKFSPDGAVIALRCRIGPRGEATIEVRDSGVGIAEQDLPHVFEPFFSTFDMLHHSSGSFEYGKRGMGMGLAIVHKFVAMHGGTVRAEAGSPCGTRIVMELPPRDVS